jgi:transcriptional regulator
VLRPRIVIRAKDEERSAVEKRARRALESAQKYSLVANSVKSEIRVDPLIEVVT